MRRYFTASLLAVPALIAAQGCSSGDDCDVGLCAGPPVGGGGDGGPVIPADCDLARSVKDSPSCVDDGVGIFVSPQGADAGDGSKGAPVRSIAKAVDLAIARGLPRVYICDGTYAEPVTLTKPLSLHGGLTCAWTPAEVKPLLAPPTGIALRIKQTSDVRVEDLAVLGNADPNVPGDSAIAVLVAESQDVTFHRVDMTAGDGTTGATGTTGSNYDGVSARAGDGAFGSEEGKATVCSCDNDTSSTGGAGAKANGADIERGLASPPVGTSNAGSSSLDDCTPGDAGAPGLVGLPGSPSNDHGTASSDRWLASTRVEIGPSGNPAQGGGGGGAQTGTGFPGGGGGCGGCGGAGGMSGGSGGVSLAFLSFQSEVILDGGLLRAGAGGAGGPGGAGQDGQAGGDGGAGSCRGGPGGPGAGGSGGGGGAGGHSAAIAHVGPAPAVVGATLTPGRQGSGGEGGEGGASTGNAGPKGERGPDGRAEEVLAL